MLDWGDLMVRIVDNFVGWVVELLVVGIGFDSVALDEVPHQTACFQLENRLDYTEQASFDVAGRWKH